MSALRAPAGRGATGDWSTITSIALVTLRALLARRRAALMLLLAGIPVLVGLLARVRGLPDDSATRTVDALEALIVATLLPITALVFGTSALGAELEDGSAIHLLTKPVARWRIVLAKLLAAAPVTAGLVAASTLITGLLLGASDGGLEVTLAVTVAVAIGSVVYATVFLALSVVTSRALIIGLLYVAIWEGALAGLFSGTRILSVRQMVRGIAAALDPSGVIPDGSTLAPPVAIGAAVAGTVLALVVAVYRLERHEATAGD